MCLKSEQRLADELGVSRRKLREAKAYLIAKNLVDLGARIYPKRKNPKHVMRISLNPNIPYREDDGLDCFSDCSDDDVDYSLVNDMDWIKFENYKDVLNRMNKVELVKFYQSVGFLVLPTTYVVEYKFVAPKNSNVSVEKPVCSCHRKENCKTPGKHPVHNYKWITPANYHTVSEQYVREFEANPRLNIGAKIYGYSVVDVDGRNGGYETYESLQMFTKAEGGFPLEENLKVRTSGGFHIFVTNQDLGNHADFFGRGVDVRSERGFHVLPGSIHKSGFKYEFENAGTPSEIPDEWFVEISETGEKTGKRKHMGGTTESHRAKMKQIVLRDVEQKMATVPGYQIKSGYREPTLFKFAARERGNGRSEQEIFEVLETIRDTWCEDSFEIEDGDLRRIAKHICEPQFKTHADAVKLFRAGKTNNV